MEELDESWVDILSGHASARFRWLDVRSRSDREIEPSPNPAVVHVPLDELTARVQAVLSHSAEIIVFGSDDAQAVAAARTLDQLGYANVVVFADGFDALRRAGLV